MNYSLALLTFVLLFQQQRSNFRQIKHLESKWWCQHEKTTPTDRKECEVYGKKSHTLLKTFRSFSILFVQYYMKKKQIDPAGKSNGSHKICWCMCVCEQASFTSSFAISSRFHSGKNIGGLKVQLNMCVSKKAECL